MRRTDIDAVREVAIDFARLPIEPNTKIPIFVSHPFLDSAVTMIPTENGMEMINVLEEGGEEKFKASVVERLKETDNLTGFFLLLSNSYRFTFLDHVERYLSDDDLGSWLRFIWEGSEYTNSGSVFTKKQLIKLFSRSAKRTLMEKDELEVFKSLPKRITVYRGTTSVNSKDLKVFSWSLSRKKAEWYANRFKDSEHNVYQAELPRDGVLAYFDVDKEIIADPYKLENIQKISA